ncbi:MAG: hypothetical protein Q4A62_06075 [Eikenella sp.]|nr:hypothetical protein [Eikenella sp.]
MFISEEELYRLKQNSYMYKDLPMSVIFYRELKRKGIFKAKNIPFALFHNFFHRIIGPRVEVMFPDGSSLAISFDLRLIHAFHPLVLFVEEYDY